MTPQQLIQMDQLKDEIRKHETTLTQTRSANTTALLGFLLLFTPILPLGILLFLAGLLAAVTQSTKRTTANTKLKQAQTALDTLRQQITQ